MSRRNRVIRDEREFVAVSNRAFDVETADRIRPIQNKDRQLNLCGFLHHVTKRRDVGIEPRADVLDIVDKRVEIFELLGFGPAALAVEGINWKPGRVVFRIRDFVVNEATNAVFGREERDEFHARRFVQHVDRLSSFAIATGVIRNQTDAHACKWFEVVSLEHVDAGQGPSPNLPDFASRQTVAAS